MKIHKTEGLILQALNFKDYDQILTVFTPEEGLVKFIVKKSLSSKGNATSPLTRAEFVYTKGKSNLYTCKEISIIHLNLELRKKIEWLKTAFQLISSIQDMEIEQRPSDALYTLLIRYLSNIPSTLNFFSLESSFRLKILKHEGLYPFDPVCSECGELLKNLSILRTECFCELHRPPGSVFFHEEELGLMEQMANSRSFSQLNHLPTSLSLKNKIDAIFANLLKM